MNKNTFSLKGEKGEEKERRIKELIGGGGGGGGRYMQRAVLGARAETTYNLTTTVPVSASNS